MYDVDGLNYNDKEVACSKIMSSARPEDTNHDTMTYFRPNGSTTIPFGSAHIYIAPYRGTPHIGGTPPLPCLIRPCGSGLNAEIGSHFKPF